MREFKLTDRFTLRSSGIDRYFAEVTNIPILTPEEEAKVAKKAANGDSTASETLIKSNLRFVISVAKLYHNGSVSRFEDLINEGNIGLLEAAKDFDPSTGFKFISYAIWYIRKYMLKYLDDNVRQVRIPSNKIVTLNKMRKIESDLSNELERYPSVEELHNEYCKVYGNTPTDEKEKDKQIRLISKAMGASHSITPMQGNNEPDDERSFVPIKVISGDTIPVDETLYVRDKNKIIHELVNGLPFRYRQVVIWTNGLDGDRSKGILEIAELLEVSTETIRLRYNKGLRLLRDKIGYMNINRFEDL